MKNLQVLLLYILIFSFGFLSCRKDPTISNRKSTYVLVHGAWEGAYAWDKVKSLLEKEGNKVKVVDLPTHGEDNTPISAVIFKSYVDNVVNVITTDNPESGKVILVGHSFGGMVISSVGEQIPNKISKLVYLAAFLPKDGEASIVIGGRDKLSLTPKNLIISPDSLSVSN